MAYNPKGLFKNFIKNNHADEIKEVRSLHQQSKISIDYIQLNEFLLDKSGKDFWDWRMYTFIDSMEEYYNTNSTPKEHISFKLINVPETVELHNLDATNNKEWISCKAMVKNITDIRVDLKQAVYECQECMKNITINIKDGTNISIPTICPDCGSKKIKLLKDSSHYRDYRLVKLEEPLELRKGGNTREFKGYMQDYLASPYHNLKAGDVVDVTGEFRVEPRKVRGKADGFEFLIDIHNITPVDDAFEDYRLTEDDKTMIIELSKRKDIYQLLCNTLAPEIYGHETVKEGLLLQLFEGNRPSDDTFKSDTMDRWTSHILLIGDPGVGKSQLVSAVNKRAPKCINIAGTNTSQAGLTTSAVKDELTGTWTMEAGGVILADTGLLVIDEFDKLTPSAQKSLNEPMEQLSVSSAKAGLVQTMTARTSILAAANPKYSRFTDNKPIKEQLDIAESTLSRFDLIFVLRDSINKDKDKELANTLLNKKDTVNNHETLSDECFKKYVTYMKANCFPILTDEVIDRLSQFYVDVRQSASQSYDGKPITARDLKSLERLTIARAKCEGRNVTKLLDAEHAIRIYTESLETLGLDLTNAGEILGVTSDKELDIISEIEKMVWARAEHDGLPLSEETMFRLKNECGVLCTNTSLDPKSVLEEAISKVKNAL
jgi:replicative DNA helicase Mcm